MAQRIRSLGIPVICLCVFTGTAGCGSDRDSASSRAPEPGDSAVSLAPEPVDQLPDVSLVVTPTCVEPGGVVSARLEGALSDIVGSETTLFLDRRTDPATWERTWAFRVRSPDAVTTATPYEPPPKGVPRRLPSSEPGATYRLAVPTEAEPAMYRLLWEIFRGDSPTRGSVDSDETAALSVAVTCPP